MQQASTTALMVAGFRAMASAEDEPLINDPWAAALVGDDLTRVTAGFAKAFPPACLWIAIRTAYLDACVARFTAAPYPCQQVVLLGAGFDTRAARLSTDNVRFFEVDTAVSQTEKLRRLALLDEYPIDAATYASCNFEEESFLTKLKAVGFDPNKPALFLWEGVSYYLTEPAVRSTLEAMASVHPASIVVFDFFGKAFIERSVPKEQQASLDVVADMGEPMLWGCNDVLPILVEAGYQSIATTRFDEACLSLTKTYDRARMFRFQSLAVASPSPDYGLFFSL